LYKKLEQKRLVEIIKVLQALIKKAGRNQSKNLPDDYHVRTELESLLASFRGRYFRRAVDAVEEDIRRTMVDEIGH
jgi:hypothetical protein